MLALLRHPARFLDIPFISPIPFNISPSSHDCRDDRHGFTIKIMRKRFSILTSDLDMIANVSPSVYKSLKVLFLFEHVLNKEARIDYYDCRLLVRVLHHQNKRKFFSLIHSCHVIACEMYKTDRFSEYMAFDALMLHLIHLL